LAIIISGVEFDLVGGVSGEEICDYRRYSKYVVVCHIDVGNGAN